MASEPPLEGLLIDWGGVLTSNLFHAFNAFCAAEGLQRDAIESRIRNDGTARGMVIGLENGTLAETDFEAHFAQLLGVPAPKLIDRLFASSTADTPMCDAVLAARKRGIRTGLISNSWGIGRYDRAALSELFDGVVISGEVGMRKPAPEMYTRGAESIGLEPARCVYVDDLAFNLNAAAELGMTTVHHVSAEETIPELERLLGVPLR